MTPITIGISLIVALMITLSSALMSLKEMDAARAKATAKTLQTVSDALSQYVRNNTQALLNGSDIPVGEQKIVKPLAPTAAELQALGLLSADFALQPPYGGNYLTQISYPANCLEKGACALTQLTYYQNQFLKNNQVDIQLLGQAAAASSAQNIGFSGVVDPAVIRGTGWQAANPLPAAPGILAAFNSFTYSAAFNNELNWKAPVNSFGVLPTKDNTAGDVRLVTSLSTPFYWSGDAWLSLNSTASNTVSLGQNASAAGFNNTHIGTNAGSTVTTEGLNQYNTHIGHKAGSGSKAGTGNTTVGANSGGYAETINNYNTIVGYQSGNNLNSASKLTLIGSNIVVAPNIDNVIVIGNEISANASDTAYIGNSSITKLVTAASLASTSDARLKTEVQKSTYGLSFVEKLRPVDYTLVRTGSRQTGLIAQEVEAVAPDFPGLIKPTANEPHYALTYASFIPALVLSVQELDDKVKATVPHSASQSPFLSWMEACALLIFLCMLSLTWLTYVKFKNLTSD